MTIILFFHSTIQFNSYKLKFYTVRIITVPNKSQNNYKTIILLSKINYNAQFVYLKFQKKNRNWKNILNKNKKLET